jgi:hypothetical protein
MFSVLVGKIREKTRIWSGSVTLVMQSKDFQAFVAQLGDLSESQRQVVVAAKVTVSFARERPLLRGFGPIVLRIFA